MKILKKLLKYFIIFNVVGVTFTALLMFLAVLNAPENTDNKEDSEKITKQKKQKTELRKYKDELSEAQLTCNSVIPQKFGKLLDKYDYKKLIMLGYRDGELGQHGYRGSGEIAHTAPTGEGVLFRWVWSFKNSSHFIKCLIYEDGTYGVTLEEY